MVLADISAKICVFGCSEFDVLPPTDIRAENFTIFTLRPGTLPPKRSPTASDGVRLLTADRIAGGARATPPPAMRRFADLVRP